jgi:hypothetical protein
MANFAKGIAAVKRVTKEIKDKPTLTSLIHGLNPDGDVSSCALTAGVIGNVISSQAVTPAKGIASKSAAEKVAVIETLLQGPKLVAVSVAPDHHFIVLPIDSDKVCILQGFQGVYNLIQWIKNRGQGVIGKAEFSAAMRDFVTTDKARAQAAAPGLDAADHGVLNGSEGERLAVAARCSQTPQGATEALTLDVLVSLSSDRAPASLAHSAGGGGRRGVGGDWELPTSPRGTEASQHFAGLVQFRWGGSGHRLSSARE